MPETDLQSAVRTLAASERGAHLSAEELLSYHAGELEADERRRVRAHLAMCPECARAVLDMASFPEIEAADPRRALSDEDVVAGWDRFRELLRDEEPEATQQGPSLADRLRLWLSPAPLVPAAAALVLAAGLGWVLTSDRWGAPVPGLNYQLAELTPRAGAGDRGEAAAVRLPASAGGVVLSLALVDPRSYPAYAVEIRSLPGGGEVWSSSDLKRDPDGFFTLTLPRAFLTAGTYEIEIRGVDPGGEDSLASYLFELDYE